MPKIIGDYKPRYIMGQLKPTNLIFHYALSFQPLLNSKIINQMISPYIPNKYSIKSTEQLIQTLRSKKSENGTRFP